MLRHFWIFQLKAKEEKVYFEMQNIFSVMQSVPDLDNALNNPVLPTKQKADYE